MSKHPFYPDVLVSRDEVLDLIELGWRPIQVDLDPEAYEHGHLPGASSWDWEKQLRNEQTQEILSKEEFEALLGSTGIGADTPVILYGDNNNWFACWAFWLMKMYGHKEVRLLDGGLRAWMRGKMPLSLERSELKPVSYVAPEPDYRDKAVTEDVFNAFFCPTTHCLLDVRSFAEYEGTMVGPGAGMGATCEVGGHIPTAINVPWNLNCDDDGTFKAPEDLHRLYASFGISPEKTVITYCAIGERASLSWFVLKHLLDYRVVLNYDRSMSQWSRMTNAPIERGAA